MNSSIMTRSAQEYRTIMRVAGPAATLLALSMGALFLGLAVACAV